MPTRRIFYRRKFLNRPRHHSGAYLIGSIEQVVSKRGKAYVDATLKLSDCSRMIQLDFGVWSKSDARNAIYKATLLRDALSEYVEALQRAIDDWDEIRKPE